MIAYGGGSAAVAYMLFRFLGKSWIENKFTHGLEEFRHQQALEIHRLRIEHALRQRDLKIGGATVPAGSGLGTAVLLESLAA